MKNIWKKGMILAIIALFISVSTAPAFSAVPKSNEKNDTIAIELGSVKNDGSQTIEKLQLSEDEVASLQIKLSTLIDLIRSRTDKDSLFDLLQLFLNGNEYPILSKIINYLIDSQVLTNRQIIVSEGWCYDFNPFKKTQTDVMKPLTVWRYAEGSEKLPIPSTTTIIKFNPMETEHVGGGQIGLMVRFKGIYVHIPQKLPDQSFTFFIGFARHAGAFDLPTLTLPTI